MVGAVQGIQEPLPGTSELRQCKRHGENATSLSTSQDVEAWECVAMPRMSVVTVFVLAGALTLPEFSDRYDIRSIWVMYERIGDKPILKLMPPPRKGRDDEYAEDA